MRTVWNTCKSNCALRQEMNSETFAEYYRRRVAELQAALRTAKSEAEQEKIKRELDPYLKEIGKDDK